MFTVLQMLFPTWRELSIHESSPSPRGLSLRLKAECRGYVETQYDPSIELGRFAPANAYRSEDLEHQTFPSQSFDLVITQDVFEHLFHPDLAIREIARTLRPGGAHVMTVPLVEGSAASKRRACIESGLVHHLLPAQYHGNPVSQDGSLVTIDWGYDILEYLSYHSGLSVSLIYIDDISSGLRASCNEVIVCRKISSIHNL
jgi:SAM-dependent methyltransferase